MSHQSAAGRGAPPLLQRQFALSSGARLPCRSPKWQYTPTLLGLQRAAQAAAAKRYRRLNRENSAREVPFPGGVSMLGRSRPNGSVCLGVRRMPGHVRDGALLDDLRSLVRDRQLLVVVGAGVTVGATKGAPTASWTGLLFDGVNRGEAVGQ